MFFRGQFNQINSELFSLSLQTGEATPSESQYIEQSREPPFVANCLITSLKQNGGPDLLRQLRADVSEGE